MAFPGAEGFGARATGGRGGEVYHVTNLRDAGPGSFREAVSKGPRIVVFDVGGYVELKSNVVVSSDLTILGQSAPGEGFGTLNYEVSFSRAHNVIARYLRIRLGLTPKMEHKYAVGLGEASDVILDHVSIQFGRWDCIGLTGSKNITVQDCIIGPGIDPQRFGCLCQSDNVTFSHNLWISNQSRSPKSKGQVQFIGNVVYNWGVCGYVGGHSAGDHAADLVNNYFIKGPQSSEHFAGEFKATDHVYQAGNLLDLDRDGRLNGRLVKAEDFGRGADAPTFDAEPHLHPSVPVRSVSAEAAYRRVVAGAGCSRKRDRIDEALIADVVSLGQHGAIIHSEAEIGGFGQLHGGEPDLGSAKDGIPDAWKVSRKLSPTDPKVATMDSGDGTPNIERYWTESLVPTSR